MAFPDPLEQLGHDHGALSALIFELLHRLETTPAPPAPMDQRWLRDHLVELREALLLHFAREEEGLFPFLRQHFPDTSPRITAMEIAHDGMCGNVTRMAYLAEQPAAAFTRHLGTIGTSFNRFVEGYVGHSQLESELLEDLSGQVDAAQRAELAELIRGV